MKKYILLFLLIIATKTGSFATQPLKEAWNSDAKFKTAFVVEQDLAVLRLSPSVYSKAVKRLRTGRKLYLISCQSSKENATYCYVAVTRRTRGYIDSAAIVTLSKKGEDQRLAEMIENATDLVERLQLCRLFQQHFAHSPHLATVLLKEGETAELAAKQLSKRASNKLKETLDQHIPQSRYWLNYSGLDRYSRLGIRFFYDEDQEAFVYDASAYKKLLKLFPNSPQAKEAAEHLKELHMK